MLRPELPWIQAILAAIKSVIGVFCAAYSLASPDIAAKAIFLLGSAWVVSYSGQR
jgi:hypothetical protein